MNGTRWQRPEFAQKIIEKYVSAQSNSFLIYGNVKDIYPVDEKRYVPLIDFLIEALIKPQRPAAPKLVIIYDPATGVTFHDPIDRQLIASELGEERLEKILRSARSDIVTALALLKVIFKNQHICPAAGRSHKENKKRFCDHYSLR